MERSTRRQFVKGVGLGAAAIVLGRLSRAAETLKKKPNVVFILADDLGWRDTALYGSTFYETPHIDGLARRGMMFTNAYAANPLCSPTRASIMTGLYPARIGITTPACHLRREVLKASLQTQAPPHQKALTPQTATRLAGEYFTLAEALKQAGYATGHFGKWHLGREPYDPLHQGFDVDVPHWPGPGPAGSYIAPWRFPNFKGKVGEHIEDRIAREAVAFLKANSDRPFFLNYWCFSVHSPYDAKAKLIAKYRAKAQADSPQRHPVMGAMIHSLDENVGRVVGAIDDLGLSDNTIIIFFSDNGGVHWRGNRRERSAYDCPITSNAPLRGGKATIYEGGTREPLIVVWPGVTRPGSRGRELVQSIDFYPTLLEMLDLRPRSGQTFDGISIAAALKGGRLKRDTIFCHFPHYVKATGNLPATSVRKGDWKLIRFYADRAGRTDRFELYNLKDDVGETNDLAAAKPDKVKQLNTLIDAHLKDTGAVVPRPNPAYDPRAAAVVAGWRAGGTCRLAADKGVLRVTSTGRDPYFHTTDVPAATGPLAVRVRMKSNSRGPGQVFWATDKARPFHRSRSVVFRPQHDGAWHEYEARLPVKGALRALRLDPGTGAGTIEIDSIRLAGPSGEALKAWDFGAAAAGRQ